MRTYLRALASMLVIAASTAWCADPPDFKENWQKLFKSDNPRERSIAIEYLGFPYCTTKEGMAHLQLLVNATRDSSPLVRETALARLRFALSPDHHGGCRADNELTTTLLKALKDPSPLIREECLRILGITKTDTALPDIAALLHDDKFTVRQQAAVALGRIGNEQALPYLLDLFKERKEWQDVFVKQEALYSIRKIVTTNKRKYIRRSRSGDKREEKNQIDADLLEKVITAMINVADDPYLRREAFEFFASITTIGARDLLKSATSDSDPAIRKLAYDGISRLEAIEPAKNSCGYESIVLALQDQNPSIRAAALGRLPGCRGQVDTAILSAHLVSGINDANSAVRNVAVAAAPSVGGFDILNALAGKFGVEPYETRKEVREAFTNIALGNKVFAVPESTRAFRERKMGRGHGDSNMIIAIEGEPPRAQGPAIVDGKNKIITSVAPPNIPEPQAKAASDNNIETKAVEIILNRFSSLPETGKITALEALEKLDDQRIKQFAVSLLDNQQSRVRSHAIILASKFGAESIVPQLFRCAQDKDSDLRYSAVRSLIEVEKLPEEYSLTKLASSPNPAVRITLTNQIQQYLVRHNNKIRPDLKSLIEKLLDDPDFEVRQWVTNYFKEIFDSRNIEKLAMILTIDGVCSNAAYALAVQGDMRGRDALYEVGKGACDVKNDWRNSGKRIGAATALRKAKDSRAVSLLCNLLEYSGVNEDYELIIQLGESRDKGAAHCLTTYGKNRKQGRVIMFSLAKVASPDALDFLKESLDTYQFDPEVQKEAITAIAVTPGSRSLDILISEIRNNAKLSNEMRSALGNRAMRDNEALIYLLKVAGKEEHISDRIVIEIGFKAASVTTWQKHVMALADNEDRDTRSGAIFALSSFHDSESLKLLEHLSASDDKAIATLARKSLKIRSMRKKT